MFCKGNLIAKKPPESLFLNLEVTFLPVLIATWTRGKLKLRSKFGTHNLEQEIIPGTSLLPANSHRGHTGRHGHLSKGCVLGKERTVGLVQMCPRVRSRVGVSACPRSGTWGKVRWGIPRSCTQVPTWERSATSGVVGKVMGVVGCVNSVSSFIPLTSTHQAGAMSKHYTDTGNAEAAFLSEINEAGG